jgi:proline iminopeptidase
LLNIYGPVGAPCVFLLHGGPSVYGYMHTLGELLQGVRVVDYAQPGTLENPTSRRPVDLDAHIETLHELITLHGGDVAPVLLGHSWGACLALIYAARHPDTVQHVIVLGAAPLSEHLENLFAASMEDRLCDDTRSDIDDLDAQIRDALEGAEQEPSQRMLLNALAQQRLERVDPAYHWNPATSDSVPACSFDFPSFLSSKESLWMLIHNGEIPGLLQQIHAPVTALHGVEDVIPCEETLAFLLEHIPHLRAHRVPKAGHFLWLEPQVRLDVIRRIQAVLQPTSIIDDGMAPL